MSRAMRVYLLAVIVGLVAISAVTVALRLGAIVAPAGVSIPDLGRMSPRAMFVVAFMPVWMVFAWAIAERQHRRARMRLSQDHRQISQRGLIAVTAFAGLPHAWLCISVATGSAPGRELMVRLCIVFVGLMFAVQGNFLAKAGPPTGEAAPTPAQWTRHILRVGWGMVLIGLSMIVCGFALPFPIVAWSGLVATALLAATLYASRRQMRAG